MLVAGGRGRRIRIRRALRAVAVSAGRLPIGAAAKLGPSTSTHLLLLLMVRVRLGLWVRVSTRMVRVGLRRKTPRCGSRQRAHQSQTKHRQHNEGADCHNVGYNVVEHQELLVLEPKRCGRMLLEGFEARVSNVRS